MNFRDNETVEKKVALVILYIQRCNMKKSQEVLELIPKEDLFDVLLENCELLFETTNNISGKSKGTTTFSELSVMLMGKHPEILSDLLVWLMTDSKAISLHKVLKIFLDYLPSSIGTESSIASAVLQETLEIYFKKYFSKQENLDFPIVYDRPTHEAMKLLVRSYLSQLQLLQMKEKSAERKHSMEDTHARDFQANNEHNYDGEKIPAVLIFEDKKYAKFAGEGYLFSNLRYEYLQKMPPFQLEITAKLYETCVEDFQAQEVFVPSEKSDLVLKKLQALFCSQVVPKQVLVEASTFLSLNENLRGNLSLQSLIMTINDAVLFLIDVCPQCILQYGKVSSYYYTLFS